MGAFPMWIRSGGKFDSNLKYVGDKLEGKVIKRICCALF